jgi:hypothetical protein
VAHFVAHVFETSRFVWSSAMARRFLLFFVTLLTLH